MLAAMEPWLPQPLSWSCALTARGGGFDGHVHEHDEICLVLGDGTVMRHAGVERAAAPGTAFLFRRGELHGHRNGPGQEPHLWLVHFRADPALERACPRLADADPARRVWRLSAEQVAAWQALFIRLMAESLDPGRAGHPAAVSGWLRLLLVAAARWDGGDAPGPAAVHADPAMAALWELLNQHVESTDADFRAALARRLPGYDSLRHRFRRLYGMPPTAMRDQLRLERAKYLLLDTGLGIAAIAERLGYARSAEFSRAFARRTGRSPGEFRSRPGG